MEDEREDHQRPRDEADGKGLDLGRHVRHHGIVQDCPEADGPRGSLEQNERGGERDAAEDAPRRRGRRRRGGRCGGSLLLLVLGLVVPGEEGERDEQPRGERPGRGDRNAKSIGVDARARGRVESLRGGEERGQSCWQCWSCCGQVHPRATEPHHRLSTARARIILYYRWPFMVIGASGQDGP